MDYVLQCINAKRYCAILEQIKVKCLLETIKKVVVFGAGIMGLQISYVLEKSGLSEYVFCDNDSSKWGKSWGNNKPICTPKILCEVDNYFVFIAMENYSDCQKQLERYGYREYENMYIVAHEERKRLIQRITQVDNDDQVLILGDCMLESISVLDNDCDSIGDGLCNKYGIKMVAMEGLYPRWYYCLLLSCMEKMLNLNRVIWLVGMDIFSGKYHLLAANQHLDFFQELMEGGQYENEELQEFNNILKERSKSCILNYSSPNRSLMDEKAIYLEKRNHMKLNYLYSLKEEGEGIRYFDKFLEKCNEKGIVCEVVLMPVNYEKGEELEGKVFREKYDANKEIIIKHIKMKNAVLHDMSYLLRDEEFISIRSINEGILEKGRKKLVDAIEGVG